MKIYYPGLADQCKSLLERVWPDIVETAKEHGYAVALHGSLARDIDVIAAPWIDGAFPQEELANAVLKACQKHIDYAFFDKQGMAEKPNGRKALNIILGASFIELSVMPPIPKK